MHTGQEPLTHTSDSHSDCFSFISYGGFCHNKRREIAGDVYLGVLQLALETGGHTLSIKFESGQNRAHLIFTQSHPTCCQREKGKKAAGVILSVLRKLRN